VNELPRRQTECSSELDVYIYVKGSQFPSSCNKP
jgi:hypothetical protein